MEEDFKVMGVCKMEGEDKQQKGIDRSCEYTPTGGLPPSGIII